VVAAARQAGIKYIVMWSAIFSPNANGVYDLSSTLQTWNGGPLSSGEIIILHCVPGLTGALETVVQDIKAAHLSVGNLAYYLPR
jgi:hypothetical protein